MPFTLILHFRKLKIRRWSTCRYYWWLLSKYYLFAMQRGKDMSWRLGMQVWTHVFIFTTSPFSKAGDFIVWFVCLMVFNATINNISIISMRSVVLVEETGWSGATHRPVASHWQTLSYNVVHLALIEILTPNNNVDKHWLHR